MLRLCFVWGGVFVLGGAWLVPAKAQSNSGIIRGTVLDRPAVGVPGATVAVQNPVSRFTRTAQTDPQGKFEVDNVPFNTYHLSVSAPSFQTESEDVDVRSVVPADVKISLKLGTTTTSISVTTEGGDLVENDPVAHTDVDRALFDKLPLESQSSSLSSLVTLSPPGTAADSNGLFHGLGDDASRFFFGGRPAHYRSAEQSFFEPASD